MFADKAEINKIVESFLNGEADYDGSLLGSPSTARERYVTHTVKRLVNTFSLFRENRCGVGDLYSAGGLLHIIGSSYTQKA